MAGLEEAYNYSAATNNAEIRLRWSQLVAKQDFTPAFPSIRDFLNSQGKLRYTLPIYRLLVVGSEYVSTYTQRSPTPLCTTRAPSLKCTYSLVLLLLLTSQRGQGTCGSDLRRDLRGLVFHCAQLCHQDSGGRWCEQWRECWRRRCGCWCQQHGVRGKHLVVCVYGCSKGSRR